MRIIEDVLCIVLLIVLPDWYLEKTGLYLWMFRIKEAALAMARAIWETMDFIVRRTWGL